MRRIIGGCLVLLVLGGCGSTPDESSTGTPSPAPTSLTAAETVQEAVRLLVAESDPDYQAAACAYFAADAYRIDTDGPEVTTVPMSRWCGQHPEALWPAGWEERDRTPAIEEERRHDAERWVRVVVGSRGVYVAALNDTADGWLIDRWCKWSNYPPATPFAGSDDPFYCLAQTGAEP